MPMPYVAAKTMEVTRSRVALVYRKVLSPVVALMMGPTMENVPTQNSRQAEMRPLARPSPPPQDKQDGEFALGQVLGEGADAQRHGGETHGKVQHVAVFLSQPFFQETPCDRSDQDTGGINNCPYHKYGQIYQKFVY